MLLDKAGNPRLMTDGLIDTLADQCFGNFRAMTNLANELLVEANRRDADQIDERIYLEYVDSRAKRKPAPATKRRARAKGASA